MTTVTYWLVMTDAGPVSRPLFVRGRARIALERLQARYPDARVVERERTVHSASQAARVAAERAEHLAAVAAHLAAA